MSTYELDDDLVRRFVAAQDKAGWGNAAADSLAGHLEAQLSIRVPAKVGAVVRTEDGKTWVRADTSDFNCWITTSGSARGWCDPDKIGRITEVLSEGVDL